MEESWEAPTSYSICCLSLHHCHCLVLFGNGFLSFMTLISPGVRNVEGNPNFSSKTRMEDTLTMVLESFGSYNSEKSQYGHGWKKYRIIKSRLSFPLYLTFLHVFYFFLNVTIESTFTTFLDYAFQLPVLSDSFIEYLNMCPFVTAQANGFSLLTFLI